MRGHGPGVGDQGASVDAGSAMARDEGRDASRALTVSRMCILERNAP